MFKKKNYLTPAVLISIYFNKQNTVLTNNNNLNLINLKIIKNFNTPFNLISEFNKSFATDIAAINIKANNVTNNLFYNYKWDFYINILNNNKIQKTSSNFFYNRIWLEREVAEFFPIIYKNLKDTRNLLLNYNENKYYLLKINSVQNSSELKTSWHLRKINKISNNNIEI